MINLLPNSYKESIRYARLNSQLLKWLGLIGIGLVGLIIIIAGCIFYIRQDIKSYEKSIEISKVSLEEQNEDVSLKLSSEIDAKLSLVTQVLSKETTFSSLIPYIGSLMPDGSSLDSLSLSTETQGGIDLSISAKNYVTASQVLTNMQSQENELFDKADATNVTCAENPVNEYPCSASIKAILVKDHPFLLLNHKADNEQ